MNKEMPLSIEWIPQNTYTHSSLDHLLPGDRNQCNYSLVKQEAEFFENTSSPQSMQNVMRLQISPKEKDKKAKLGCLDLPAAVSSR